MSDLIQEQTKRELIIFSRKYGPAVIVPATVLAVNDDDTVHVQFSDDSEIDDVRLKSVVKDGNKFLLIPAVNSIVQVARIENSDECLVVALEEITEVKIVIDGVSVSIDSNGFLFQKGNDSLKGLIDDLFSAISHMIFTTNVGPTIKLVNQAEFDLLKQRFDNFFKG